MRINQCLAAGLLLAAPMAAMAFGFNFNEGFNSNNPNSSGWNMGNYTGPNNNWGAPNFNWGSQVPQQPPAQPQQQNKGDGFSMNRGTQWNSNRSGMSWGNRWTPSFGNNWAPGYGPGWNMAPGWQQPQYQQQGANPYARPGAPTMPWPPQQNSRPPAPANR